MTTDEILHNPVFEGSEKRLEVDFTLRPHAPRNGLRALSRDQLDELMTLARCCIVSSTSNEHFDSYVLSESSLFVYPNKWVLKTCGTTRLLNSVPLLLGFAGNLGVEPVRCKFSRATFLFPEQQLFPHTSFDDEVQFLDSQFANVIGSNGKAYVLGHPYEGLQWHKYVVGRACAEEPTYNLEICMTELGEEAAKQFFRGEDFVSSAQTTKDTGILQLKPGAIIDDYVFEPCGYSMNGIEGTGLITIHITPESGFSYASVEVSGSAADVNDPNELLAAAIRIFNPGKIAMALSVDQAVEGSSFGALSSMPAGYGCPHASAKKLECGGAVTYYNLASVGTWKGCPDSPTSILHHNASFLSLQAVVADSDDGTNSEELEPDLSLSA